MKDLIIPSPVQELKDPLLALNGVHLYVKRDDLIHPEISGNKWRKLKGSLDLKPNGIITFGGAFSNHIYATAAAGYHYGIKTIGIIRGELDSDNPTIKACQKWGMELIPVSRSEYKLKLEGQTYKDIANKNPEYLHIPEGGSNSEANIGLAELAEEINTLYDYIILAAGTGGTARGLINALPTQKFKIISSLKGISLYDEFGLKKSPNLEILDDYHHGGYGKTNNELIQFINQFTSKTQIPLDPIYNGKVVYAIYDLIKKGLLSNCSILWIHTGGIQGVYGYNYMSHKKGKPIIEI